MDKPEREKAKGSLTEAEKAGKKAEQAIKQFSIKRAGHIVSWLGGVFLAVLPPIRCLLYVFLHNNDHELKTVYSNFNSQFFSSGSFLWVSSTLLAMSLLELFPYGVRHDVSPRWQFWCKVLVIVSAVCTFIAMGVYFNNITEPIDASVLLIASWIVFGVFVVLSGIISFFIVEEV